MRDASGLLLFMQHGTKKAVRHTHRQGRTAANGKILTTVLSSEAKGRYDCSHISSMSSV